MTERQTILNVAIFCKITLKVQLWMSPLWDVVTDDVIHLPLRP